MAITVDWPTKVISVPKADMTLIQETPIEIRELDLNEFRLALKALEADEGMPFLDMHSHNTTVSVGGILMAHVLLIINDYTVTFEDGSYVVSLVDANSNVLDVTNPNNVSVRSANSAGLVDIESVRVNAALTRQLLVNKTITDPDTGVMTVYDDDDTTPLLTADIFEDADGTTPFSGSGANRRDRLT